MITNSSWTINQSILNEISKKNPSIKSRLVASLPNFEKAYLSIENPTKDKPYAAIGVLQTDDEVFKNLEKLLAGLTDFSKELPNNALEWNDLEALRLSLPK